MVVDIGRRDERLAVAVAVRAHVGVPLPWDCGPQGAAVRVVVPGVAHVRLDVGPGHAGAGALRVVEEFDVDCGGEGGEAEELDGGGEVHCEMVWRCWGNLRCRRWVLVDEGMSAVGER
jgi:hypothetical protein